MIPLPKDYLNTVMGLNYCIILCERENKCLINMFEKDSTQLITSRDACNPNYCIYQLYRISGRC